MSFRWFSDVKSEIGRATPGLNMKSTIGFAAVFSFSLLARTTWGSTCSEIQYPLDEFKCCNHCPPGEELAVRCTHSTKTSCEPCEDNYYKNDYIFRCKRCAVCDEGRGLQEVQSCTKKSNTVCVCLPGYAPPSIQLHANNKRCDPCPNGYFSKGGKEQCQRWRNCTAHGLKTLHPGNRERDAVCDKQPAIPLGPTTVALPSSQRQEHGRLTTEPSLTHASLATHLNRHEPKGADNGLLWIFLSCAGLLLAVGGPALLLLFQKAKKKKGLARCEMFSDVPHEDGRSSYRIPIQEEQMDSKSSLARN